MRTTSSRRRSRPRSAPTTRSRRARTSGRGSTGSSTRRSCRSTGGTVAARGRTPAEDIELAGTTLPGGVGPGSAPSAESTALSASGPIEIRRALADLPEEQRVAVYLADVEGFAYREIAGIMESPVGTVMSRLHRGRAALRSSLADYAQRSGMVRDLVGVAHDVVGGADHGEQELA